MRTSATAMSSASPNLHDPVERFAVTDPAVLDSGSRVRIIRGPLLGLTGVLVEREVCGRWLVQADHAEGVFVRAEAQAIEPF